MINSGLLRFPLRVSQKLYPRFTDFGSFEHQINAETVAQHVLRDHLNALFNAVTAQHLLNAYLIRKYCNPKNIVYV